MSDVIFNVADKNPYDCLYFSSEYGYRACLNGKRMDILDIETVKSLKNVVGLQELYISKKDVDKFEKCLYGGK